MKVYIIQIVAYVSKEDLRRIIDCHVGDVFDSREKAVKFIEETWPETKHVTDPEHWVLEENEDFSWRACYYIEEREVE